MTARLLLIDARVLTPDRDGGSVRMWSILKVLQALGCSISFVPSFPDSFPPFDDSLTEDTERMRSLGIQMPAARTTVDEYLAEHGSRYDIVLVTGTFVASRHFASVRKFAPQAVLVFDTIDLHFLREYRGARMTSSIPRLQSALKIKRVELTLARAADFTLVVSEREQTVLAEQHPSIRSWVVPIACAVRASPGPDGRRGLVYLGAFSFDPNLDAMQFFVRDVLPGLRKVLPDVTLEIAGSDPTSEVLALQGDGVTVSGFQEDLADCFDRRRMLIAPLRYGAGVKSKVILSMAHGLPVVASPIAAEGIPARAGRELLIANEPAEWVSAIARLHEDRALWLQLAGNGRELIQTHHSHEAVRRHVEALFEGISQRLTGRILAS
jgi:glycosyltransferase involved in cell wall biosynthesis